MIFFKEATYPPSEEQNRHQTGSFWKHLYWKGNEPSNGALKECNALLTPFLTTYNFII